MSELNQQNEGVDIDFDANGRVIQDIVPPPDDILDAWALEEAYIEACESMSPNAPGFDDLRESIYERIIESL